MEVNLTPPAYNVLVDILQEYESAYLKERIRAYRVGGLVSDEMLNENAQNICNMYGITIEQLKSKTRQSLFVMARVHFSMQMRLMHNATILTIAKYLNRDHTSILNYFKGHKINSNLSQINPKLINDRKTDTCSGVQVY